jgi:phosphoserine aminotransferase
MNNMEDQMMKYGRTYNFSAGPAMMPEAVLEEIAAEMMNYRGSGMCVMEMSHRSKVFEEILAAAKDDLKKLMGIPDNYKILFVQGGGTLQFAMVAMNLLKGGVGCYVETGAWSKKAISEAKKFGEVKVVASSADKNFSYVPDCSDLDIPDNADYVYICENETINGLTYNKLPNTKGKVLVSDQSSMFLSRPCNVADYGMIWAGVQKNVGPAGMAVVIIREDLIRDDLDAKVPTYLSYKIHADNDSLYNTPNCWAIYCCGKVFNYLLKNGGLEAMEQRNQEKAKVLYDYLDQSKLFTAPVEKADRSLMNVPFVSPSKEQDAAVVAASKAAGFDNLKGHKSVGGLRASIYNAMPKEGVEALVDFLKKYEQENA